MRQTNLHQLETLLFPRSTIKEAKLPWLLARTTALKTLYLGFAYRLDDETALENGPALLQALNAVSNSVENLSLDSNITPTYPALSPLTLQKTTNSASPSSASCEISTSPVSAPPKSPSPSF